MTTPLPVPTAQTTAGTAGTGYYHRTWLDEMADALGRVAAIRNAFGVMTTALLDVKAGRTQLAHVEECQATALQILIRGVNHVDATDTRYMPVVDAIRLAGGQDEVAQDKHYHDRT